MCNMEMTLAAAASALGTVMTLLALMLWLSVLLCDVYAGDHESADDSTSDPR
jgi:hypothetical protein